MGNEEKKPFWFTQAACRGVTAGYSDTLGPGALGLCEVSQGSGAGSLGLQQHPGFVKNLNADQHSVVHLEVGEWLPHALNLSQLRSRDGELWVGLPFGLPTPGEPSRQLPLL